jgi:hypothetical protein
MMIERTAPAATLEVPPMPRCLPVLALGALLLPAATRAEILPTLSVHELCYRADVVVAAVPTHPEMPGHFRVREVFRGTALKPGDVFRVPPQDLPRRDGETSSSPSKGGFVEILLFLKAAPDGAEPKAFLLVPSGVRCTSGEENVLVPRQLVNTGPYVMVARQDVIWGDYRGRVREVAAEMDHLLILAARPAGERRTQALFDWVERHRNEFGGGFFEGSCGWGTVEEKVFDWLLESDSRDDVWRTVRLYAALNRGALPRLPRPVFATPEGRAFLCDTAWDERQLAGDRARALALLAAPGTLGGADGRAQPLTREEQKETVERLRPLLSAASTAVRSAAVRAVQQLSAPKAAGLAFVDQSALSDLVKAYKDAAPGALRDDLAEAVCAVGGERHWQELTGNPHGLVVCLADLSPKGTTIHFWVAMRHGRQRVAECPMLVLERLDEKNAPVEKKEVPLPLAPPSDVWGEGWDGSAPLRAQLSLADFAPGVWQFTVKGTVGKDRIVWASETRRVQLSEPPKPNERGPKRLLERLKVLEAMLGD